MRRFLLVVSLVSLLVGFTAAGGQGAGQKSRSLTFKVRLIQEATYRHPHPPAGDAGDVFATKLRLFADGTVLGFKDGTPMGTMAFSWWFTGSFSCGSAAPGCKGTTNLRTVTKLPGGTITAGGNNVSLARGLVVPIQSGTGIFKGVKGTVTIAPGEVPEDIFSVVLPS